MTDEMKLHWKLHFEKFPNEKLLKGFENPIKSYLSAKSGKILDIGCGQSLYLLDMLDSNFELFGVDIEESQLNYLKERVIQAGFDESRIIYSSKYFPSPDFESYTFQAIILSDILHFFTKTEALEYVGNLKKFCEIGGLIIGKIHSKNHYLSKKKINSKSYFKSFYNLDDIIEMFPKSEFKLMSFVQEDSEYTLEIIEFIKHWFQEALKDHYSPNQIKIAQDDYLKDSRENFIKFVVKKK